ncbi:DUF4189 domain-containing protein [Xanthomonas citri]|uniref:DUF4189 domain-containing protein n=1 Tax=Xanthomonas citri TaxID=346 RepID=UPI001884F7F3|nr:DUF4189 domain-containing protein [Xanthomonas citri]QOY22296.1 DUF4189 domain-containing protein [Xanthomonas citri]QQK68441.1 DUF4189 domain-containing protein [Xanthomonas citri]
MKYIKFYISILLLSLTFSISAQTACPVGVAPGSPQCGPDSGTSRGDMPTPPPTPTGEWIKTWGAIAMSNSTGDVGTSVGKFSDKEAKNSAINQCAKDGAADCKIQLVYRNQCSALASSKRDTFFQASSSKEEATDGVLAICERSKTGSCSVMYSDCSDPFFKKY